MHAELTSCGFFDGWWPLFLNIRANGVKNSFSIFLVCWKHSDNFRYSYKGNEEVGVFAANQKLCNIFNRLQINLIMFQPITYVLTFSTNQKPYTQGYIYLLYLYLQPGSLKHKINRQLHLSRRKGSYWGMF